MTDPAALPVPIPEDDADRLPAAGRLGAGSKSNHGRRELDLDMHARPKACLCRRASLVTTADHTQPLAV